MLINLCAFFLPFAQIFVWTGTVGLTLIFGVITAKLYRVAYIFRNPSLGKTVRSYKLISGLSFLISHITMDPFHPCTELNVLRHCNCVNFIGYERLEAGAHHFHGRGSWSGYTPRKNNCTTDRS